MPTFFKPNRNFAKDLAGEPQYIGALVDAAKQAEGHAKSFAPVDEGDYRDGIKVKVIGGKVYLSGTDYKSHWIEWGSSRQGPSAPLRRGVRAAGLRLKESPKT